MLRAVVVDDESLAREELQFLLHNTGAVEVVGVAATGEEALRLVAALHPDVVFLDVQMPVLDGFQVAAGLLEAERPPMVVFATAYDEYALKAFEVHALDYLLKPLEPARVNRTVKRLQELAGSEARETALGRRLEDFLAQLQRPATPPRLPLEREGRVVLVSPGELLFAYADRRGSRVRTATEEFATALTLRQLEEKLSGGEFVRVHRHYLVNLERVREFIPWPGGTASLVLADKNRTHVPVSRQRVAEVRARLGLQG